MIPVVSFEVTQYNLLQGVLLIAVRRPFDLGDRILVSPPDNVNNYGYKYTWIVEDINLFTTTLRFASTNEVATVNNGTLALLRIVNCARSFNAVVSFQLKFELDKVSSDVIQIFRSEVEQFLKEKKSSWESLLFCRCDEIDYDYNKAVFILRAKHQRTWQEAPIILASQAELSWRCMEIGKQMGINYNSPTPRREICMKKSFEETDEPNSKEHTGIEAAMKVVGLS